MASLNNCSECNLVYKSGVRQESHLDIETSKSEWLELKPGSIYIHTNESILSSFDQIDSRQQQRNLLNASLFVDKNVLIVGCGPVARMPILAHLVQYKFNRLVCLSRDKQWAYEFYDDWIYAEHESIDHKEETRDRVCEYMRDEKLRFDAILTYDDFCVEMSFYLADCFNLPSNSLDTVSTIRNKYTFRQWCSEQKINHPEYLLVRSDQRLKFALDIKYGLIDNLRPRKRDIEFPVICKNSKGCGKDFVRRCNDPRELAYWVEESIKHSAEMDLLVEEYYDGHEIDIDLLVQDNHVKFLIISDNHPTSIDFKEQGGSCPSVVLNDSEKALIEQCVKKWIRQLKLDNCCLHFEAKCRPKSLYKSLSSSSVPFLMPIEINLRLGGAETWSMIKSAYGVDLLEEYLKICLGVKVSESELKKNNQQVAFCRSVNFQPEPDKKLRSIWIDAERVKQNEHVAQLTLIRWPNNRHFGWLTYRQALESYSFQDFVQSFNQSLTHIVFEYY